MSSEKNEKAIVKFDPNSGFVFDDIDGMFRAARCFLDSGFAPPSFRSEQQLIICWATAAELGIRPLQAIQGMNVINGRLGIGGDLAVAKVRSMGLLLSTPQKRYSGTLGQDDYTCTVTLHRKGEDEPQDFSFSIREAKQAGIYKNNWLLYPQRMTYYRALGFGMRDMFSDVLKGMYTSEELADFHDDGQAGLASEEQKIAQNQATEDQHRAKGVKTIGTFPGGKRPTPAEAAKPAFPEDANKPAPAAPRTPPFAEKLRQDWPTKGEVTQEAFREAVEATKAAALGKAESRDELDMGPAPQEPPQPAPQPEPPFTPKPAPVPAPKGPKPTAPEPVTVGQQERPVWMDHKIKSIPHKRFIGKKIGELEPADLAKVETQWMPQVETGMANASSDQLAEYELFKKAIEYRDALKPF